MSKTYNRGVCYLCGQSLSNAGLAVAAHNRKHIREGLMTETPAHYNGKTWFSAKFTLTDLGGVYYIRIRAERPCACRTLNGHACSSIATINVTKADGSEQLSCEYHQWAEGGVARAKLPSFPITAPEAIHAS